MLMIEMNVYLGFVFCILIAKKSSSVEIPNVKTRLGTINGVFSSDSFKGTEFKVKRFLGIPYALPPVGKLRFKKPEAVKALSPDPYPADTFGPPCAQVDMFGQKVAEDSLTEDCLFLNIFVPVQEPDKKTGHAVMVYIHGGGFSLGTGNRYIGDRLSSVGNVIVVTINYRLWIWGFLDFNDERAPGNMGLWDQQMAMKWVNENIEAFGGDKNRVTIFGQSAGAISVSLHALFPTNEGLFQNVIAESGVATTLNNAKNINDNILSATFLAQFLNCSTVNNDEVFGCIQNSDRESLFKAFRNALKDQRLFLDVIFAPTVDGEFMKSSPSDLLEQAKSDVPVEVTFFRTLNFLNGLNGEEGGMWLQLAEGTKETYENLQLTQESFDSSIIPMVLPPISVLHEKCLTTIKTLVSSKYKDWNNQYRVEGVRKQFVKLLGDLYFNVPGIEISRLHANGSNPGSFLYRFTANVERHLIPTPSWVDSGNHADEIGPVFGYNLEYEMFREYSPPEWELDLSERIMMYFTNFAKYSNPNDQGDRKSWPEYTTRYEHYLNIDREDHVGQYLHADDVNFWREIVPMVKAICHEGSSVFPDSSSETCDAEGGCY